MTISHAFYNTLVNFTIGHTLDLEGKSDTWLFYYCLIIALGISSCTAAIITRRFSVRPEFEQQLLKVRNGVEILSGREYNY